MTIPLQDDAAERRIAELIASFLNREQNVSEIARICWREATEAAALKCEMTRAEVSLRAGEMTAGEWRTVKAILADRAAAIRGGKR